MTKHIKHWITHCFVFDVGALRNMTAQEVQSFHDRIFANDGITPSLEFKEKVSSTEIKHRRKNKTLLNYYYRVHEKYIFVYKPAEFMLR